MTEAEWLACAYPTPMLEFLRGKASERKLRLFACACCRRIWHLLIEERSLRAVEVAERFAEGTAPVPELNKAEDYANDVWNELAYADGGVTDAQTDASEAACSAACYSKAAIASATSTSRSTAYALSYDGREAVEHAEQCHLLRDIFANPFRPQPSLPPAVLAWNDGTVRRIAERVYEDRRLPEGTLDTARLAILADALLDAGCDDEELLAHCRSAGPHVRGCWGVDLILGKV